MLKKQGRIAQGPLPQRRPNRTAFEHGRVIALRTLSTRVNDPAITTLRRQPVTQASLRSNMVRVGEHAGCLQQHEMLTKDEEQTRDYEQIHPKMHHILYNRYLSGALSCSGGLGAQNTRIVRHHTLLFRVRNYSVADVLCKNKSILVAYRQPKAILLMASLDADGK